jgi:ribonuclease VapC
MSAATFLEAAIVVDRLPDPRDSERFDELIARLEISIEPVLSHQAVVTREAYRRFGRGSGIEPISISVIVLPTP